MFFTDPHQWVGAENQNQAVRDAFKHWKNLGIGLEFEEVQDAEEAEIRIGFQHGAGSWSYVGRDAVDYVSDPSRRTMNFGWDLTTSYGRDTALHEIGHALGFPHEHQNPSAGIVWNVNAVIDEFSGPPNCWDEDKIRRNILRKINPLLVEGSAWDPNSIMHYRFREGLILKPERYQGEPLIPNPGLSQADIAQVQTFYPQLGPSVPELRALQSATLSVGVGEQADFIVKPKASRKYTIQTFGSADTVIVLFEQLDGTKTICCWRRRQRYSSQCVHTSTSGARPHLCGSHSAVLCFSGGAVGGDALVANFRPGAAEAGAIPGCAALKGSEGLRVSLQ